MLEVPCAEVALGSFTSTKTRNPASNLGIEDVGEIAISSTIKWNAKRHALVRFFTSRLLLVNLCGACWDICKNDQIDWSGCLP